VKDGEFDFVLEGGFFFAPVEFRPTIQSKRPVDRLGARGETLLLYCAVKSKSGIVLLRIVGPEAKRKSVAHPPNEPVQTR
jgi:hypothetical protein